MLESFFKKLREPTWVTNVRETCADMLEGMKPPTRKDEEWRYTDFTGFTFTEPGEFAVAIDAPKNVYARTMPEVLNEHPEFLKGLYAAHGDQFELFNLATWTNGYFIRAEGDVKRPVIVKHVAGGPASSLSFIVAEPGSRVTVCEIFEGNTPLHYGTLRVIAKENAEVNVITIQKFGKTWDFTHKHGLCEKDARINWTFALLGGHVSKLKEETDFTQPGASSELKGVYFGTGDQHFAVLTKARHDVQNTRSRIETRGVLRDKASSLARGLIRIEKQAKGTDAHMTDRTLHLNSGVRSNSVPSLEIENNDVRAGHGASTGKIDETQLFYMMSRGLSRKEAETLIVQGFFEPIVNSISVEDVREGVRELIQSKI